MVMLSVDEHRRARRRNASCSGTHLFVLEEGNPILEGGRKSQKTKGDIPSTTFLSPHSFLFLSLPFLSLVFFASCREWWSGRSFRPARLRRLREAPRQWHAGPLRWSSDPHSGRFSLVFSGQSLVACWPTASQCAHLCLQETWPVASTQKHGLSYSRYVLDNLRKSLKINCHDIVS